MVVGAILASYTKTAAGGQRQDGRLFFDINGEERLRAYWHQQRNGDPLFSTWPSHRYSENDHKPETRTPALGGRDEEKDLTLGSRGLLTWAAKCRSFNFRPAKPNPYALLH